MKFTQKFIAYFCGRQPSRPGFGRGGCPGGDLAGRSKRREASCCEATVSSLSDVVPWFPQVANTRRDPTHGRAALSIGLSFPATHDHPFRAITLLGCCSLTLLRSRAPVFH